MTATPAPTEAEPDRARGPRAWLQAFAVYREPPVVRMLFLGFSAGLPLLLVFGTLSFWLREAGVDRTTIGFVSWVALAYAFKWAWAPLVDRLPLPWLSARFGRRRSWLLASQVVIAAGLLGMALTDPALHLRALVLFALLTAFASATQDIALDAYRIESAATEKQAALAAAYQTVGNFGLAVADPANPRSSASAALAGASSPRYALVQTRCAATLARTYLPTP